MFIGGILYWGPQEEVVLINRGSTEVSLGTLVLRDEELEEEHASDLSNPHNLIDAWETSSSTIPPGGFVYVFKVGGKVWRDTGEVGILYDAEGKELDRYPYKGPG